ncbi:MAG: bifunctional adenosylcobinamide kinase/adenosylcobinamide-phosphate guanylyltransferase [bacterium]|nr:bifunctional adenosylcobinamide kinase/adenosylcobinamide-phosphate guanylyltransferase [bacterium]
MSKLILVLGGIRSGKSQFACQLADQLSQEVAVIVTCIPQDKEMKARIKDHRLKRPKHWQTIEAPKEIRPHLQEKKVILIDCLNMFISNLLLDGLTPETILEKVSSLAEGVSKKKDGFVIIVSNEVGSCLVPTNKLARQFTDLLGKANQIMASCANEVYLLVSGIPVKIKEAIS